MGNNKICADHDELVKIEFAFLSESERCKNAHSNLKKALGTLKSGDWVGESAEIFYTEMDSFVLPAMQRLVDAFVQAATTTRDINKVFMETDKDIAALWKSDEQKGSNKLARVEPPGGNGVTPTPTPTPTKTPTQTPTPSPTSAPTPPPYLPLGEFGEWIRRKYLWLGGMDSKEKDLFVNTLKSTQSGRLLLALQPDLIDKIDFNVFDLRGYNSVAVSTQFDNNIGKYIIGIGKDVSDMSNPANAAILAHEVFHVFQREQAGKTDPNRATDFTQKRMEIEAYQFQYAVQAELAKDRATLINAKQQLASFAGSYSDALKSLLSRTGVDATYINSPEGKGGSLDSVGFPPSFVAYILSLQLATTATHTPTPSSTPTPSPTTPKTPASSSHGPR